MPGERTHLLDGMASATWDCPEPDWSTNPHAQFCILVGVPPSLPPTDKDALSRVHLDMTAVPAKSLYGRATNQLRMQRTQYYATATLSSTLLLSQVVLGAALTALGASESSHRLVTAFGAANTVIAGLVAYLRSRGQPMRARMFLNDLERVVGEIEDSEVMWLGIAHHADGYDHVSADGTPVTVHSEVARLTTLYDRAVRGNNSRSPDMWGDSPDGPTPTGRPVVRSGGPDVALVATASVSPRALHPGSPALSSGGGGGGHLVALGIEEHEPGSAAILVSSPEHGPERKEHDGIGLGLEVERGTKKSHSASDLRVKQWDNATSRSSSSAEFLNLAHHIHTRYRDV